MRSIWTGALSFGLINIPVRLYSATEEHAISFDLLHKKDLSPVRYARICKAEEKEIPYEDIVKGYEYQKGEYVVIEEEIFKQVDKHKTETIEIVQFTDSEEIDSIYFEKPYYLEPGKGADKSYALLRETLKESGKVGVVKFVLRTREHIGIIKPYENAIILNQMRYSTEVRNLSELKLPEADLINKKEIEMALKLVDQLSDRFDASAYHDEFTEELEAIIQAKVEGIPPAKKGASPQKGQKIHDIMSLLKASLESSKSPNKVRAAPKKKKKAV